MLCYAVQILGLDGSMLSCTTMTTFLVFRAMLRLAPCLLEAQVCAKHVCLGLQILSDLDLDPGLRIISVSKHPNLLASQVLLSVVVVVVVVVVVAVILLFLFRSKTSRCHSCLSDQSAFWYSMQLLLVLPPKLEPSKHISILIVWQADILKHAVSEQTSSIRWTLPDSRGAALYSSDNSKRWQRETLIELRLIRRTMGP